MNKYRQTYVRMGIVLTIAVTALTAVAGDILLLDGFESATPGDLNTQQGWTSAPTTNAQVQTSITFAGDQAASLSTTGSITHAFSDPTATNIWIDFRVYTDWIGANAAPLLDSLDGGGCYVASNGVLHVWSNTTWVATDTTIPQDTWQRLTVNIDYTTTNWTLYIADDVPNALSTLVASGLPFQPTATNTYLTTVAFEH